MHPSPIRRGGGADNFPHGATRGPGDFQFRLAGEQGQGNQGRGAETEDLRCAVGGDQDGLGAERTVDHQALVSGLERRRPLAGVER